MSRKFATVSRFRIVLALMLLTILAGAASVHAQQTPGQQPPPSQQPSAPQQADTQQPSSQDTSTEEIGPIRKPKVKDYKNWTFNVGGGANLTNGNTRNFVRGGG